MSECNEPEKQQTVWKTSKYIVKMSLVVLQKKLIFLMTYDLRPTTLIYLTYYNVVSDHYYSEYNSSII